MTSRILLRPVLFLLIALPVLVPAHSAFALEPDEIALVVNSNVPESNQLAEFYAKARHIPDNRILVLDLPAADEMPFKQYEEQVVPQVRDFLKTGQLNGKVKCFVTFYGVPLRIADRVNTSADTKELADIRQILIALPKDVRPAVEAVEADAVKLNPEFKPEAGGTLEQLHTRFLRAWAEINSQARSLPDQVDRARVMIDAFNAAGPLMGEQGVIQRRALELQIDPDRRAKEQPRLESDFNQYKQILTDAGELELSRWDDKARAKLRPIVLREFELISYNLLLDNQAGYLDTTPNATGAAFDSQLSLVGWTAYNRPRSSDGRPVGMPNPLIFSNRGKLQFPTYMVSRLDAPTPELVKSMVTTSIAVEAKGLSGRVVLDSLGDKPGEGPPDHREYGDYDQHFRNLADLLKKQTKLDVYIEESEAIIPPGSQPDVALYCGWHSAGQYVNSCKYVPGAVGYHIASYELTSMRAPGNNGWVRGLLSNGVVSSIGPVEEPYLGAFPRPDEYFPLLLTGKLTAAEVYWKTVPWSSWMMACVGDPLYNPYKNNPVLTSLDLPFPLRAALPAAAPPSTPGKAATEPSK